MRVTIKYIITLREFHQNSHVSEKYYEKCLPKEMMDIIPQEFPIPLDTFELTFSWKQFSISPSIFLLTFSLMID